MRSLYPDEYKTYITNMITYCRNTTYHGVYRYVVTWAKEELIDGNGVATIDIDCMYQHFSITMGNHMYERWKNKDFKAIGQTILHEICHLFFYPMKHLAWENTGTILEAQIRDIDERQTQMLSVVIFGFLPQDWFLPSKVAAYMKGLK